MVGMNRKGGGEVTELEERRKTRQAGELGSKEVSGTGEGERGNDPE